MSARREARNILSDGEFTLVPKSGKAARIEPASITPGDLSRLLLVTFLWALCYPLIATGLSAAPPLTFAALRSFVAGLGLLAPAVLLRRPWPEGWRVWSNLMGVGLGATGLGFAGMFLGGGVVSPGLATVLSNAQPLIAAGLAYFVLRERLGHHRRQGLWLGFVGIFVVAAPGFVSGKANSSPMGVAFVLMGALGVAMGNVLLKRLVGQVDLLMATGWQFVLGGLSLSIFAWQFERPASIAWGPSFLIVLLTLGLLGTALAFALWFSLLHRAELTRLNTFTFLTPIFALFLGMFFFNERLSPVEMACIGLVLAGVWRTIHRSTHAQSIARADKVGMPS